MKISIVTGVWKRPEVFELFAQGISELTHDVNVIIAGSEGDRSRKMVESKGFDYIEIKNQPLADKMNSTTLAAKGSDYVVCLGSDDILSPKLFDRYVELMERGYDFIGLLDLYFFDLTTRKAIYWGGYREAYRKGFPAGAGICLSAKNMNKCNWMPWERQHNDYLDNSMKKLMTGKVKLINLKTEGLFAVDIKSKDNMTPFERWDNTVYIDPNILRREFHCLSKY